MTSLHLTKSRYLAGLQCGRRLWLQVSELQPYEPLVPGSPMDVGQEIGRKGRLLFPGGSLIDEEPWRHEQAAARTAALIDARVPAIFEGVFEFDESQGFDDALVSFVFGNVLFMEAKCDVILDRNGIEEGGFLEDHADASAEFEEVGLAHLGDVFAEDVDGAAVWADEAVDQLHED